VFFFVRLARAGAVIKNIISSNTQIMAVDLTNFGSSYSKEAHARSFINDEDFKDGEMRIKSSFLKLSMVAGAAYELEVGANSQVSITGNATETVTGDYTGTFANHTSTISGTYTVTSTGNVAVSSSGSVSWESSTATTVTVGGAYTLGATGAISISGASGSYTTVGADVETIGSSKSIVASTSYSAEAGTTVSVTAGTDLTLTAEGNYTQTIGGSGTITYGGAMNVTAPSAVLNTTGGLLELTTVGGDISVSSSQVLNLESTSNSTINMGVLAGKTGAINIGTGAARTITIGVTGSLVNVGGTTTLGGDLTVEGNLNIRGTTTTIDSEQLLVVDKQLILNDAGPAAVSDTSANTGGIVLQGTTQHTFLWNNKTSGDAWETNDSHVSVPTAYTYQINNLLALSEHQLAVNTTTEGGGVYMAGPTSFTAPSNGEWRIRQDDSGANPVLLFERYANGAWVTRFRMQ